MDKQTQNLLLIGGVVAAAGLGYWWYSKSKGGDQKFASAPKTVQRFSATQPPATMARPTTDLGLKSLRSTQFGMAYAPFASDVTPAAPQDLASTQGSFELPFGLGTIQWDAGINFDANKLSFFATNDGGIYTPFGTFALPANAALGIDPWNHRVIVDSDVVVNYPDPSTQQQMEVTIPAGGAFDFANFTLV